MNTIWAMFLPSEIGGQAGPEDVKGKEWHSGSSRGHIYIPAGGLVVKYL